MKVLGSDILPDYVTPSFNEDFLEYSEPGSTVYGHFVARSNALTFGAQLLVQGFIIYFVCFEDRPRFFRSTIDEAVDKFLQGAVQLDG
jgi:hypothetical protein